MLACLVGTTSCHKEESTTLGHEIKLFVKLASPDVEVSARGVSDDPKNENNTWTIEEQIVDGSRLYRVTLLVVDDSDGLVGMRDWSDIAVSLPSEVSAVFEGLRPDADYRMIAVANYSAYDEWPGLAGFPNLAELSVGDNISATLETLNNYTLSGAGEDYVVKKNPQPLSLEKHFTTPAQGELILNGELLRTYARMRIEIANRSESKELNVNSLKFGASTSMFGYKTERLFQVVDSHIPVSDGNLVESSADAITAFTPLTIPTLNDEAGNSKVVFDGYMYECRNTAGFEYSLNVSYPIGNGGATSGPVYEKGAGQKYPQTNGLYMIGYGSGNRYLTVDGTNLTTSQNAKAELDPTQDVPVIWEVIKNGYNYTFRSVYNDKYIHLTSGGVSLDDTPLDLYVSSSDGQIRTTKYPYYCLNVGNDGHLSTNSYNLYTAFTFYPLSERTKTIADEGSTAKDFNIALETLINGVPNPTYIIRRNDFINVLVTVSYNENYNTIDFHVTDWAEKEGNVEFN